MRWPEVESLIFVDSYSAPAGELILGSFQGALCLCDWRFRKNRQAVDSRILSAFSARYEPGIDPVLVEARRQLDAYFQRKLTGFSVPLLPVGTDFQKKVWQALAEIPYGETCTYAELTKKIGPQSAIRAVAAANGANALSLFLPCHRVVGKGGALVGYAGGIKAKRFLLELEGSYDRLAPEASLPKLPLGFSF